MTLLCHTQIRTFEYKTFRMESICLLKKKKKIKYADNDGINITLMFKDFLIKNH